MSVRACVRVCSVVGVKCVQRSMTAVYESTANTSQRDEKFLFFFFVTFIVMVIALGIGKHLSAHASSFLCGR